MAELHDLRKRLQSIRSTGQLAGAMRTAATAKYAKLNRMRGGFAEYARECRTLLYQLGSADLPHPDSAEGRDCLVILGGNRGMCGGFNAELLRFLEDKLGEYDPRPRLIVCGKKAAAWLREHRYAFEECLLSDTPAFAEVRPLADRLREGYASGEIARVSVIYQSYQNTLIQRPAERRLLPSQEPDMAEETVEVLCLPDRNTLRDKLVRLCFEADLFDMVLENASGAQAATIVATRSACDNAEASAADLELIINRRRQAEVTSSVIETASGMLQGD